LQECNELRSMARLSTGNSTGTPSSIDAKQSEIMSSCANCRHAPIRPSLRRGELCNPTQITPGTARTILAAWFADTGPLSLVKSRCHAATAAGAFDISASDH
jgi:hypothetical protein